MVFLTKLLFRKPQGPDPFWRKRKIFRIASHFFGRKRNCYSLAIRGVTRALQYSNFSRKLKKEDLKGLWDQRILAAGEEHGITPKELSEGLHRCNILLNRKVIADLAVWEPQSFRSLVDIAASRIKIDRVYSPSNLDIPPNTVLENILDDVQKEK